MNIQELIKKIKQWAIDRGLDKNGTVEGQLIKTAEEVAELIIGISKDDIDVIKDSVGDVFVTLVVGNLIFNQQVQPYADNVPFVRLLQTNGILEAGAISSKYKIIKTLSEDLRSLLIDENYYSATSKLWMDLNGVCLMYGLIPLDCVESAYKEISGRKGVVKNGTFVKEDDLI